MPTNRALFGPDWWDLRLFQASKHRNGKRSHPKHATQGRITGMLHPTTSGRAAVKLLKRQRRAW
jgi:hypothetical protein